MPPPAAPTSAPPPAATLADGVLRIGGRALLSGIPPSITSTRGPLPGSLVLGLDLGPDGRTAQADVVLGKLSVTR